MTPLGPARAEIWKRPLFWFAVALLIRLPALRYHELWECDGLGFLYFGAALAHGRFLDLGDALRDIPPAAPLLLGMISWLPAALQTSAGYLIQALLGAAWVFPLHALILRRHGTAAAVWGMALAALLHPLVGTSAIYLGEPLFVLALLGALATLESEDPRVRGWGMLLWPVVALTRAEGMLVALAALAFTAWRSRRDGDIARRNSALFAAGLTLTTIAGYWLLIYRLTGAMLYTAYVKHAVGLAVVKELSQPSAVREYAVFLQSGLWDFFTRIASRLPRVVANNLAWWTLRALPGALSFLYPALLLGAWGRVRTLRAASDRMAALNALDAVIVMSMLIQLCVYPAHHHVALVLAPVLPMAAAGLEFIRGRWPRGLAVAALLSAAWTGWHIHRNYTEYYPEDNLPAYRLGREMGPLSMSNDIVALDGGGRTTWLGQSGIPWVRPNTPPDIWLQYRREFPQVRFAIVNSDLEDSAPPIPADWPLLRCVQTRTGPQHLCVYQVPSARSERATRQ